MLSIFSACSTLTPTGSKSVVQLSGIIDKPEMTTYQYGTHVLKSGNRTYALKSSKVDLSSFMIEEVKIKGIKVEGYPVENGPELIDVLEVDFK